MFHRAKNARFSVESLVNSCLAAGALAAIAVAGCAASPPETGATDAATAGADAGSGADRVPVTGTFEMAWEDNFDSFDSARWQLMTHSWDGNLAQFSTTNTKFENGIASLQLTNEPTDTAKPFRGVEMRSRDTLTYGKIEARAKFAKGSGVVSALVLIYTPWPADDWNELDVEYLGRYTDRLQDNAQVYTGTPTVKPVTQSVSPTQFPMIVDGLADPSADFHVYGIEWTPNDARFTIDGVVKYTWSSRIERMKLPQNILLTIWASASAGWAGPIQADTAPTAAAYDWIRVYNWKPSAP